MSEAHTQYRGMENSTGTSSSSTSWARIITNILLLGILGVSVAVLVTVLKNNGSSTNSYGNIIPNLGQDKTLVKTYYDSQYGHDLDDLTGVWTTHFYQALPLKDASKANTVVFDLDETVLWNMPVMFQYDFGFISKEWNDWVVQANATCIPQTCALYQFLVKSGFNIVFITGRHGNQRAATELNLQRIGLTTYDQLIVRSTEAEEKMSAVQFKSSHRKNLTESAGYTIVGCIGDQLSDCQGGWAGFIMKVPNYAYFIG